ncbi:hypothetical protein [Nonomuraea sp. 10N515B]
MERAPFRLDRRRPRAIAPLKGVQEGGAGGIQLMQQIVLLIVIPAGHA